MTCCVAATGHFLFYVLHKLVHGLLFVLLTGLEHGGGEVGVVGGVGEVLGLQAEAPALVVGSAVLAHRAAVHVVAGVELHAGGGGVHLHGDAGGGGVGSGHVA